MYGGLLYRDEVRFMKNDIMINTQLFLIKLHLLKNTFSNVYKSNSNYYQT